MAGIIKKCESKGRYHYFARKEWRVSLFCQRVLAGIIILLEKNGWYQLKVRG